MHLALYCFATGQLTSALKLMYRARYLILLVFGEEHPEMAQCDVSISLIMIEGTVQLNSALKLMYRW